VAQTRYLWRAGYAERCPSGSEGGSWKRARKSNALAAYPIVEVTDSSSVSPIIRRGGFVWSRLLFIFIGTCLPHLVPRGILSIRGKSSPACLPPSCLTTHRDANRPHQRRKSSVRPRLIAATAGDELSQPNQTLSYCSINLDVTVRNVGARLALALMAIPYPSLEACQPSRRPIHWRTADLSAS